MEKINPKNTAFLIDGSSFLYRAYYSLRPLHTSKGVPVQAVYSFCRMIKKLLDTFKPQYIALVWDSRGITARHELFPEYKATRQEPPSDLSQQKQLIQDFAVKIGLLQIAQDGVEADDLMYSLAKELKQQNMNIILVTSDKDMYQMLDQQVKIFDSFKDAIVDAQEFQNKKGFPVEKLPFYFALLGDASDNIPGVRGIGQKGATELVQEFKSLEDLYQHLDKVTKKRMKEALESQKNNAFLSYELFLLRYYPQHIEKDNLQFDRNQWNNALPLFQELNFKSLIKDMEHIAPTKLQKPLSEAKGYVFKTVTTIEDLERLCAQIKEKKLFALDTELDGLRPLQNNLVGLCICIEKGTAYYVPFDHVTGETQLDRSTVLNAFKPLLEDLAIKKIMHHAKFDMLALAHYGIFMQGLIFDTLLAGHLVTQDWQRVGLKYLSIYYLQEPMAAFQDIVLKNGYKTFAEVPLKLATEYAASDAHQTLQLKSILDKELDTHHMHKLYYDIELPLVHVLCAMEYAGIFLDTQVLAKIDQKVTHYLHALRSDIIALIGDEFKNINLNSPKQLTQLLFEHLKLPPQKKTTTKAGYSTDIEVLEELALLHPVPGLIARYRELFKLKSTYIDALPEYINPQIGRIHTNFSQTAVATGRLSSSDPNLQNIPLESTHFPGIHIREAFKARSGYVFLSADYSQIELRVLAFLSQDSALINAFLAHEDIHRTTAAHIFGVSPKSVTSAQRQIGKRINFSILYGLTPYGLSKDLKIPFKDAKTYIETYFAQYPGVSAWMEKVIEETKQHGYVTTYWGRRRYIPGIYEENKTLYDLAKRTAINTKAQGTAAEIMKIGMIRLHDTLQKKEIDAKILLQIHDELLLSVAQSHVEHAQKLTKEILESVVDWNVPLVISTHSGINWHEVSK